MMKGMQLETTRLLLTPLRADDAEAMFPLLSDPATYRYLDDRPPACVADLRSIYERQSEGRSADGTEQWFNWIVRDRHDRPLGYVQATVLAESSAYVAYLLASKFWGHGYASESLSAMLRHLVCSCRVSTFLATVEVENRRSINLLQRTGFTEADITHPAVRALTATERLYILSLLPASRLP
jgi:RimJ/RimL family protein N-acetyltransferase